ncbi:hypothetical protein ABS767_16440 [Sphingomonas sp. ST-64]|uniref:Tetratricopeptide repeat-containing protein n=1 Tax=Sphingomonas plantiphila TaxID=3163295 RepID=A0ABW8YQK2_9SPHN
MKRWMMVMAAVLAAPGIPVARADDDAVVAKAVSAFQNQDCPTTLRLLKPLVKPGVAEKLSEPLGVHALYLAAVCESYDGRFAEAQALAVRATAYSEVTDELWHFRLFAGLNAKDAEGAAATVLAMREGRGGALNTTDIAWLYRADALLREAKRDALRERVLQALVDNAYDPEDPVASKDGFYQRLMRIRLERGDVAGAREMAGRIETAPMLLNITLDPRYRDVAPRDLDIRAAVERQLSKTRDAIARNPGRLTPLINAARLLRALGQPKAALEILEKARAPGRTPESHVDGQEMAPWWWNSLAETHIMLGDADAAIAAMREGSKPDAGGVPQVSQLINLASTQIQFRRYADALKALPADDAKLPLSPFGAMQIRLVRLCANAGLGNTAALAADRSYIEAKSADDGKALSEMFLCLDDRDAAAKALIAELEDPDRRVAALTRLSNYDPPLPGSPVSIAEVREAEVKQRPDVQAALEKAGGARRIPLQEGEL